MYYNIGELVVVGVFAQKRIKFGRRDRYVRTSARTLIVARCARTSYLIHEYRHIFSIEIERHKRPGGSTRRRNCLNNGTKYEFE